MNFKINMQKSLRYRMQPMNISEEYIIFPIWNSRNGH